MFAPLQFNKGNLARLIVNVTGVVSSWSAGTTGLTPAAASSGAVVLGGVLNVTNGGTGVTTSTGSGSVVLNTSAQLVTPDIGVATGTSLAVSTYAIIGRNLSPTVGGSTAYGARFFNATAIGVFTGTGSPTVSAPQGSIYARSDGPPYYNTSGSTTWAPIATSASPALTGVPTAPTAAAANNSTQIATTAYADRTAVQQVVSFITGAVATGTTVIPIDDTIPQITEGDQYMSLAITPKSATSKLVINVVCILSNNTGNNLATALFQDATANALAVTNVRTDTTTGITTGVLNYSMTSGTTSATTFRVRAGCSVASTTTFNGFSGGRIYGGAMASSIIITEIGI